MILTRFSAENYRNIERCEIAFEPGVNLLLGDNAQGKTNAVECIYSFARGKSFRGAADSDLIRFGESGFVTSLTFRDREREQTLSYSYLDGVRRRERNGVLQKRLSEMIGHFRAVLFYPEHLQIVKSGPAERREFLNVAISQNDPTYLSLYATYQKITENRNFLLKSAQKGMPVDMGELDAWSQQMADAAARIYMRRKQYIDGFSPFAADILSDISKGKEKLTLKYQADVTAETVEEAALQYRERLTADLRRECAAGCSLYGVHRDDMEIELGGLSARIFASQGQQRSVVLALKMAEGEYSRALTGEYPVFLFDDVLSELDEGRRSYVLGDVGERQFILTACDKNLERGGFHEIRVEDGRYVSAYR